MEFRDTLLAAQRNQQQKSSVASTYYKARFDPPKKEQKVKDRLSDNIQKFLAQKEEEERQKKLEAQRKREEFSALRDPKALRKIQKTLKVIKSANKSVLADAVDRDHTAVTREGLVQPDQDDYGYESREAAALYEKMMQKYIKLPEEPKFPTGKNKVVKDINGTRERVKHALQNAEDPVPQKRKRRGKDKDGNDRETSPLPKYESEEKKKQDKPKIRKPMPPPMDFNQLLKLAEEKKSTPLEIPQKKVVAEPEPDRLMTKKQKRDYEEEMARRQRRQERIDAEKAGVKKVLKEDKPVDKERRPNLPSSNGRIPKLSDKNINRNEATKAQEKERDREKQINERDKERQMHERDRDRQINEKERDRQLNERDRDRQRNERDRERQINDRERVDKIQREKEKIRIDKDKADREKERADKERLDKLKAERERIDREMERLNKDREKLNKLEKLDKTKSKLELSKPKLSSRDSIDLKSQNTYRIDKSSNENRNSMPQKPMNNKLINGHHTQGKPIPKLSKEQNLGNKSVIKDKVDKVKQKTLFGDGSPKLNGNIKTDNSKRLQENNKGVPLKRPDDRKPTNQKPTASSSKPSISNSFDFDKHVNSIGKTGSKQFPPGDVKRKSRLEEMRKKQKRPVVASDSEYDSEMDDFIDDGDENMDYSKHIKEIFGYDKSRYRDFDDDDDRNMESSFSRQQREEYISKKIGIMEDLEDMRMEAMEKNKKKKTRRISD